MYVCDGVVGPCAAEPGMWAASGAAASRETHSSVVPSLARGTAGGQCGGEEAWLYSARGWGCRTRRFHKKPFSD